MDCPRCGGTGEIEDPREQGKRLRDLRVRLGRTLTEVAAAMGLSKAYVSDLELGRRTWRAELELHYITILGIAEE